MHQLRFCAVLLSLAAAGQAKAPSDPATVCERYQHADLVFTGSADTPWMNLFDSGKNPIHKRSTKIRRVRFQVREWFKGPRQEYVDVWMAPSDCPLKIEANQTYLIYAHKGQDKKGRDRMESNGCMGTMAVDAAAADIKYLTVVPLGPAQATHVAGVASGANLTIQAQGPAGTRYATTDSKSAFTFDGLPSGEWSMSVLKGSPHTVEVPPNGCVAVDLTAH